MLEHKSGSSWACSRLHKDGIHAGATTILCLEKITRLDHKWQWFPAGWRWTRVMRNDWEIGYWQAAGVLCRKRNKAAVYDTGGSTPEWLRGGLSEELQGHLKESNCEQVLTPLELQTCLVEVANLVSQRPIDRIPNDLDDGSYLCPNDVLLGRASTHVPQGPFRQKESPAQSGVCPENRRFVLDPLDERRLPVIATKKTVECREMERSSRWLRDHANSRCSSRKLECWLSSQCLSRTGWQSQKR